MFLHHNLQIRCWFHFAFIEILIRLKKNTHGTCIQCKPMTWHFHQIWNVMNKFAKRKPQKSSGPSNLTKIIQVIVIEGMVSCARLCCKRDNMTPGICCLIMLTARGRWCYFPRKMHSYIIIPCNVCDIECDITSRTLTKPLRHGSDRWRYSYVHRL